MHPCVPTRLCWHNAAQSSTQTLSQVAVHRGKGNIPAAIDTLAKFLDLSPLDADGWQELSELYIMVRDRLLCRLQQGINSR